MSNPTATGYRASGNYASGYRASGNYASGYRASGYRASGDYASGDYASGHYASGHYASGDYASGHYAAAERATGFFATESPKPSFFDVEVDDMTWDEADRIVPHIDLPLTEWIPTADMTDEEKAENPSHTTTGGYLRTNTYHDAWAKWWGSADDYDKQQFLDLPHFDAAKFQIITGIDVAEKVEYITIGDRKYRKDEVEAALADLRSEAR